MLITRVEDIGAERRDSDPPSDLKTWRVAECPFVVEYSFAALERIRREVESGRNRAEGERETGGVLFGIKQVDRICILASRPLVCEHALGPGFVLSANDEARLAELISTPATDPELSGLAPLGWYHSHLRSRVSLSERDRQMHARFFGDPYHVALVVHPRANAPARAGFFFQELSGEMHTESSYAEFTIEAPAAVPEVRRLAVPTRAGKPREERSKAKSAPLETPAICPKCGSKQLRRSRRTGPLERLGGLFGAYPYRCHECLSRSFLKTSPGLLERARSGSRRRPDERKRARQRTRREILLWGGGIIGFLAILYYLIRDTGPKPDFQ